MSDGFASNNVRSLLASQFLSSFGMYLSTPYIAAYLVGVLHASYVEAGIYAGLAMASYSLSSPIVGRIIDGVLVKWVFLISTACSTLPFILMILFPDLRAFYISALFLGVGRAAYTNAMNVCASIAQQESGSQSIFSAKYAALNAGAVVAPIISSHAFASVSGAFSWTIIFTVTSNFLLYKFGGLRRTQRKDYEKKYSDGHVLMKMKRIYIIICGMFLLSICISQMTTLFPFKIMSELPNWKEVYSKFFLFNAITVIVTQFILSKIPSFLRVRVCVYIAPVLLSSCFLIFGFFNYNTTYYIAIILMSLGEAIIVPCCQSWISDFAPAGTAGRLFGIYSLSQAGSSVGPILFGYIASLTSPSSAIISLSVVPFGIFIFLLNVYRSADMHGSTMNKVACARVEKG